MSIIQESQSTFGSTAIITSVKMTSKSINSSYIDNYVAETPRQVIIRRITPCLNRKKSQDVRLTLHTSLNSNLNSHF